MALLTKLQARTSVGGNPKVSLSNHDPFRKLDTSYFSTLITNMSKHLTAINAKQLPADSAQSQGTRQFRPTSGIISDQSVHQIELASSYTHGRERYIRSRERAVTPGHQNPEPPSTESTRGQSRRRASKQTHSRQKKNKNEAAATRALKQHRKTARREEKGDAFRD